MKTVEMKPGGRHQVYDEVSHKGTMLRIFEDGVLVDNTPPTEPKRGTISLKKKSNRKR